MRFVNPILLTVLFSCQPKVDTSKLQDLGLPISKTKLTIALTHNPSVPEWSAHYQFDQPVTGYAFMPHFQRDGWKVRETNQLQLFEGPSGVAAKDGSTFQSFTIDFDSVKVNEQGGAFEFFSDDSVAFLSQILLGLEFTGVQSQQYLRVPTTLKLTPRENEQVVTDLGKSSTTLTYPISPRSPGTYFYFGSIEPVINEDMSFVLDSKIGRQALDTAVETESKSYKFLTEKFGTLPFKPLVLIRQKAGFSQNSASGVASWGSFLINITGDGQALSSSETSVIQNAVIHETAHFWNALVYQNRMIPADKKRLFESIPESFYDQWIWEGGAQALALETRKVLGYESEVGYLTTKASLILNCMSSLGDKRVIDTLSDLPAMTFAPYHCGEALQFAIVDVIAKQHTGYDIFELWKGIFTEATDMQVDNDVFFRAVRKDSPYLTDQNIDLIKSFLVSKREALIGITNQMSNLP